MRPFNSRPCLTLCCLAFLAIAPISIAYGHHSMSSYDVEQEVLIEGTVSRVQWVNPHVYIYLEESGSSGTPVVWAVEGLNPSSMRRLGWTRDTLRIGDRVAVSGNPGKTPGSYSIYPRIMLQDDETIFDESVFYAGILSPRERAAEPATSLAGVWKTQLTPNVITPRFGGSLHDMTEKGARAHDEFDELSMNPGTDCGLMVAPMSMHFGDAKHIDVQDQRIVLQGDYDGGRRVVHMNLSSHDGAQASEQGHSIGRWDGDTLVIDTTYFTPHRYGNGLGIPSGQQKRLVEKLSLVEQGYVLRYEVELSDPEYLATPLRATTEWVYSPDLEFTVEECDLESARRYQRN